MMDARQRAALSVVLAIITAVTLLPAALGDGNGTDDGVAVAEPPAPPDDQSDTTTTTAPPDDSDDTDDTDEPVDTTTTSSPPPVTTVPASTTPPAVVMLSVRAVGSLVPGRDGIVAATVSSSSATARVADVTVQVTAATVVATNDQGCARSNLTVTCRVTVAAGGSIDVPVTVAVAAGVPAVGVTVSAALTGTDPPPVTVSLPTTDSGMAARLALTGAVDVSVVGNTLASCADGDSVGSATCAAARAATAPSALANDFWAMTAVVADGRGTGPSSSAELRVTGDDVATALLVWSASTSTTTPAGAATVKLATPTTSGGGPPNADDDYVIVPADDTTSVSGAWQSMADVTDLVAGAGAGDYWVADVAADLGGPGAWAGWALVVVHEADGPVRDVVVFDGLVPLSPTATAVSLPATAGSVTPDVAMVAWDGDRAETGELLQLIHTAGSTEVFDEANPSGDVANSSVSVDGAAVTDRTPSHANTLGVDIDRFGLDLVTAPLQVAVSTTGDDVTLGVVAASLAH